MAGISSLWQDDYWLLVMQLYMRKPVGLKRMYSRQMVDLSIELHLPPSFIYEKMFDLRNGATPFLSSLMQRYKDNPRRLRADAAQVRSLMGFSRAAAFYEGGEVKETFEKDFRQIPHCEPLTPVALILVLDLYFRLTPLTMVAETPEVVELSQLMRIEPSKTAEVLGVFQYCDPYLNRQDVIFSQLLGPCEEIWSRYAQWTPVQLAEYADKLKDYFKS